jgi:hypothetical protein
MCNAGALPDFSKTRRAKQRADVTRITHSWEQSKNFFERWARKVQRLQSLAGCTLAVQTLTSSAQNGAFSMQK